jgi:uncharacterized protein YdhG (YjbR/CyaY superfamily)
MTSQIEEYIESCPPDARQKLRIIRDIALRLAPGAEERISYNMPSFYLNRKPLIYYAAFKHHIGFYPIPTAVEAFRDELSRYRQGKGSVQFPLTDDLPTDLIERIIRFRITENNAQT